MSDFFTIGVGRRDRTEVRSSGKVGILQSGPRLDVPAGRYRVRWYGTVDARGRARVELGAPDGAHSRPSSVAQIELEKSPSDPGKSPAGETRLLASVDATFPKDVHDLEFRFFVESEGLRVALSRIIFEEIWTDL